MLKTYHHITKDRWKNGYSHVGGGNRTGWLILNNGRCVQWMMMPGGLAWLRTSDGQMIYLAKELTRDPRIYSNSQDNW